MFCIKRSFPRLLGIPSPGFCVYALFLKEFQNRTPSFEICVVLARFDVMEPAILNAPAFYVFQVQNDPLEAASEQIDRANEHREQAEYALLPQVLLPGVHTTIKGGVFF